MDSALGRGWGIAAAAGVLAILLAVSAVQAQVPCQYEVTIIQAPECPIFGFPPTIGLGLSEQGHIVGYHLDCEFIDEEAFVWTPETGLVTLPFPAGTIRKVALDIEGGLIVGRFDILGDGLGDLGFVYDHTTGELTNLGTLPGGNFSDALAIDQGIVVGNWGNNTIGPIHGFIWQNAVMTDLGPILGTPSSRAFDITNGAVTGWMGSSPLSDARAMILEDGVVAELPAIPGGFTSEGRAINTDRDIAGRGRFVDPETGNMVWRGFAWVNRRIVRLDPLPGFTESVALGLNDSQLVVGASEDPGLRGFIWRDGTMTDLNDLIPPELDLTITVARAINQAGQITATAGGPDGTVAVLLTPIEPPLGDLTGDCRVGILDLLTLLANWGRCPPTADCPADINGDGTVDVLDLLRLLSNWG